MLAFNFTSKCTACDPPSAWALDSSTFDCFSIVERRITQSKQSNVNKTFSIFCPTLHNDRLNELRQANESKAQCNKKCCSGDYKFVLGAFLLSVFGNLELWNQLASSIRIATFAGKARFTRVLKLIKLLRVRDSRMPFETSILLSLKETNKLTINHRLGVHCVAYIERLSDLPTSFQ